MAALLLRDRYHILALDQRGHGDSDWNPSGTRYTWEQHERDITGFIDAARLERFALLGMSLGGLNALRYTARHPERVRALVIVDIGPDIVADGRANVVQFRRETQEEADSPEWFLERAVRFNPARPVAHLRYSLYHALKQTTSGRWTWKADRLPAPVGHQAEEEAARRAEAESLWQDWRTLACPTLILRGEHSRVVTNEASQRAAASLPKGEFREIANAGHNVHGDNPAAFAAAVDDFLTRSL
ncbi:MAG: alpha/beta hydrolase [Dehalococcoidia bacterium]